MPPRGDRRRGGTTNPVVDPTVTPLRGADRGGQGRSGIGDARRYTPRGRSIREADAERGAGLRGGDPFRPALQVVRGGGDEPVRRGRPATAATPGRAAERTRENARTAGRAPTATGSGGRGPKTATKTRARRPVEAGRPPVRRPKRQIKLPDPRRRLRFATVLTLVMFLAIFGRLVELQLMDAKAYAAKGLENRLETLPLAAPRGTIYDRDMNVLADSVETRYVYADPGMVTDPVGESKQLATLLGVPVSQLLPKLSPHKYANGQAVRFEYLAHGVGLPVAGKIMSLNLPGIGSDPDERRDVPGHDLAANLIGYTNYELTGVTGLESSYNDVLKGTPGHRTFEVGGTGVAAEIPGGYHEEAAAHPGSSIELTIDRDLQFQMQYLVSQQAKKIHADFMTAVAIDPHTGEVLGQASYPGYDAAEPNKTPASQHGDSNTGLVVDPGSVAKVVTLGGALQEGVIAPNSTVTIGPTIRKGDTTYSDTHPFPVGTKITLPGVLAYSSNVATIEIADKLGAAKLYAYQRRFGLGAVTGEGLPGESPGLVQPPANWSGSSYGSIPIGDGVSVTPLQMTAIYATIANGGVWVQPHLVKAVIGPDRKINPTPAPRTRRVLSTQVADELRTFLEAVTTVPGATGHRAVVPGYRVAGKTGTGKFVGPNGRYETGDVGSFVGMAPADAPRYVIGVFAHSPGGEGGDVSAPAFAQMMAFLLGQNHVPPTGTTPPSFQTTG